jgi:SAM-dependent methyltransferase
MSLRGRLRAAAWLARGRVRPLSAHWGRERGTPVDRWFIERFLRDNAADIRGDVLEVMDDRYTTRFGTRVTRSDVLDVNEANAAATVVADLADPAAFPRERYDCCVLTQTLQFVYDVHAAVASVHACLRPGGVCLATVPTTSRLDRPENNRGEFWRFTPAACKRLFGDRFDADAVEVAAFGNAAASVAFLIGMPAEELDHRVLAEQDALFPLLVAIRAVKR